MNKLNTAFFACFCPMIFACVLSAESQTILQPDTVTHKLYSAQTAQQMVYSNGTTDSSIERRLVQLALQQPKFDQADAQQKIAEYTLEKQRRVWLNLLSLSVNYNDQTFAKRTNTTTAYVYPKYFFGVTVPLGLIFNNGSDVKITRQSERIAKDQALELQQTIRASVLSSYHQYQAATKLLALQNQITDDAQVNFLQVQQKFSDGKVTLDAYNEASQKYTSEQVKAINQQLQQDLAKLEVEKYIGRNLEDIFK